MSLWNFNFGGLLLGGVPVSVGGPGYGGGYRRYGRFNRFGMGYGLYPRYGFNRPVYRPPYKPNWDYGYGGHHGHGYHGGNGNYGGYWYNGRWYKY